MTTSIYLKPSTHSKSRVYSMIHQGLRNNPLVRLVENPVDSDFIFVMCTAYEPHNNNFDPAKLVHIDYRDEPQPFLPEKCLAYFKRSWVEARMDGKHYVKVPKAWPKHFYPISYAIMDEFIYSVPVQKDIDVGCYLRPNQTNRVRILAQMLKWAPPSTIRTSIGPVNNSGRSVFDHEYLLTLARTKIVVTCNPDRWEGDSRTWEALANRCLVFVDPLYALPRYPLRDGEHCVFYDVRNEAALIDKLDYFAAHMSAAAEIAENGYRFAMAHHRTTHRIDEILERIL